MAGDEADLAQKIITLYQDNALRRKLGQNGKKAVGEKYNWANSSRELLSLYTQFVCKTN